MKTLFDENYYERGIETQVSGYQNYRWIPELTIPLAYRLIQYLGIKDGESVLDFGCAKGYLVYALSLLGIDAYGYDVSEYAIESCQKEVSSRVSSTSYKERKYDWVISKDVFEHLDLQTINDTLDSFKDLTNNVLIVVPLAENGKFIVPSYELDITHISRYSAKEWGEIFEENGWDVVSLDYTVDGIKDNYKDFKYGNGFFILSYGY